jgi:hypothetical protein
VCVEGNHTTSTSTVCCARIGQRPNNRLERTRRDNEEDQGVARPNQALQQTGHAIEGMAMRRRALLWLSGLALVAWPCC